MHIVYYNIQYLKYEHFTMKVLNKRSFKFRFNYLSFRVYLYIINYYNIYMYNTHAFMGSPLRAVL